MLFCSVCAINAQTKHISQTGTKLIRHYESLKLHSYRDCAQGIWTVGWGHTKNVKPGMVITNEQADQLFKQDLSGFEDYIYKISKRNLKYNEFDALTSFSFNAGFLIKGDFQKSINLGDAKTTVYHLMQYNKGRKIKHGPLYVIPGLTFRRRTESGLYQFSKLVFYN